MADSILAVPEVQEEKRWTTGRIVPAVYLGNVLAGITWGVLYLIVRFLRDYVFAS